MSDSPSTLTWASPSRSRRMAWPTAAKSPPAVRGVNVRTILDVPYVEPGDARHRLDLFLPGDPQRGHPAPFPMIVFAHGGSWNSGDKAFHGHLGHFFAKFGIGTAVVNYRLA